MDRRNLALDVAALAVFLVVANPALTGIGIHEWLGLGMFLVFFVHALLHVDCAVEILRGSIARPAWGRTGNLVLDLLIVVVLMAVTVSGVMVSGAVLPTFGVCAGVLFLGPAACSERESPAGAAARARRGSREVDSGLVQEKER